MSSFAVGFPGGLSLSLSSSDPGGCAFLGQVYTLRAASGAWLCEHRGPRLGDEGDSLRGLLGASPAPLAALIRSLWSAFAPHAALLLPLPTGADVAGFYLSAEQAEAARRAMLCSVRSCGPRRRRLARPALPLADGPQLLADGSVVRWRSEAAELLESATPRSVALSAAAGFTQAQAPTARVRWVPDDDDAAQRDATQAPPQGTAATVDLSDVTVFSSRSMLVGLPGLRGRQLYRPWFLSRSTLREVTRWAVDAQAQLVVAQRSAARRDAAAAAMRAAVEMHSAATLGRRAPPAPPPGEGGDDEAGSSLEDGGVEDTGESMMAEYMREFTGQQPHPGGGAVPGGAEARTPLQAAFCAASSVLLAAASVCMQLGAPVGDSCDALVARTPAGRRALVTGTWHLAPGDDDVQVDTFGGVRAAAAARASSGDDSEEEEEEEEALQREQQVLAAAPSQQELHDAAKPLFVGCLARDGAALGGILK